MTSYSPDAMLLICSFALRPGKQHFLQNSSQLGQISKHWAAIYIVHESKKHASTWTVLYENWCSHIMSNQIEISGISSSLLQDMKSTSLTSEYTAWLQAEIYVLISKKRFGKRCIWVSASLGTTFHGQVYISWASIHVMRKNRKSYKMTLSQELLTQRTMALLILLHTSDCIEMNKNDWNREPATYLEAL